MSRHPLNTDRLDDYKIGFICRAKFEYDAIVAMLDDNYGLPIFTSKGDTNLYCLGQLGKYLVVVAVTPPTMLISFRTHVTAVNMNKTFTKMKFRLIVGVGGGAPTEQNDIRLGDVVVGVPRPRRPGVIWYDYDRATQGCSTYLSPIGLHKPPESLVNTAKHIDAVYQTIGQGLNTMINDMLAKNHNTARMLYERPKSDTDVLFKSSTKHHRRGCKDFCAKIPDSMEIRNKRATTDCGLKVHCGTIASSDKMVKVATVRDNLAVTYDALCFDTDTAKVMHEMPCLVIRGISHYCDSHDYGAWTNYAAIAAAAFAKDILKYAKLQ